jgi:putative effector of murein hydrolase
MGAAGCRTIDRKGGKEMREVFMNVPVMLSLTTGAYLLGLWVKKKSGLALLHPFVISIPVILAVLHFGGISYSFYKESNFLIDFLLGPSVVSLGYLLYRNRKVIKVNALGISAAVIAGSAVGVLSVFLLGWLTGLDELFLLSLEAKSVTTPVAMDITASVGGNPTLAAVSVVACGFIGAVAGPLFIRLFHIKSPVAKGLAMGCSSHGLGTAKAIEMGAVEGAVSGLSIALMGIATALLVPLFNLFLI